MTDSVKNNSYSISIGPNVKFVGSIYTPSSAKIEGEVTGKVEAADLVVGKTGHVKGEVTAENINVHGQLHDEVNCTATMWIHSTGQVTGNLLYSELEIVRGGSFEGTMLRIGK